MLQRYPGLEFVAGADFVASQLEAPARALYAHVKSAGFTCSFSISTLYGPEDAATAELGLWCVGGINSGAAVPKDAFDFSTGCVRCGLGAALVKPSLMSQADCRSRRSFISGPRCTRRCIMRSEIGREIIEATGQPWCMRHPVTRDGRVVKEWMEPVPCATMPPLSRSSQGVMFGRTSETSLTGEPPRTVPGCPVCKREVWDYDEEHHPRLLYPRAAVEAAQQHAVVSMFEPWICFPSFDLPRRTFSGPRSLCGLPELLFSRRALNVLARHADFDDLRDGQDVQPVYSEPAPAASPAATPGR